MTVLAADRVAPVEVDLELVWAAAYHLTGSRTAAEAVTLRACQRSAADGGVGVLSRVVRLAGRQPGASIEVDGLARDLLALPVYERAAVVLHDVLGLPLAQVAGALRVSAAGATARLLRGRAALLAAG